MSINKHDARVTVSMIIYPLSLWSIVVCLVLIITLIEMKQMTIVESLSRNLDDNTRMTEFIRDQTNVRDRQMKELMRKVDGLEPDHSMQDPANADYKKR